ncbi:MAG: hypothetical protein ACLFVI_07400 [Archaeoglobaceae archaeon]
MKSRIEDWKIEDSFTYFLMATGKSNRLKKTVRIESIYYDIMRKEGMNASELVNYLLEKHLREVGWLDVEQFLDD